MELEGPQHKLGGKGEDKLVSEDARSELAERSAKDLAWVQTAGCGKPIVLVHGFGASLDHYKRNFPVLAANYKVYALDLLGFGRSAKPVLPYTMEQWEELVVDFLGEFVEQPAVIVGNSLGSLTSLMVSASAPDRIAGTVLLNCAGGMNNKAISDDFRIKLAMPIFLLIDYLLAQPRIARYLFDRFRTPENIRQVLMNVYTGNPAAVDQELVDMIYSASCDEGALEAFVSIMSGPPGPRPEELIPKISTPMLVLWGTKDPFTPSDGPVGRYFQRLAEQRPGSVDFVHLPGVGHCPHDEAPDEVHGHLLPWLEKHHA
ncbi:hypothetical protein N2152v2_011169 [Parachlorella kessleri]